MIALLPKYLWNNLIRYDAALAIAGLATRSRDFPEAYRQFSRLLSIMIIHHEVSQQHVGAMFS